jgi:xanthine dehydrogenase accessory factor
MFEQNIFARLADWQAEGLKTGLATLVDIDGSSPRPRGAQIGVAEDGRHVGIISSGCAEEAIISEALTVLQEGTARITRYGKDSPYLDVVLPCGSGLDILFSGAGLADLTDQVGALHAMRKKAFVTPQADNGLLVSAAAPETRNATALCYAPDYHLHAFGAGPQLVYFVRLAHIMGYSIFPHSTDDTALAQLQALGIAARSMTHQSRFSSEVLDEYSAVITLFHEHNLELPILEAALNSNAHYIGAMGSRATHMQRRELLGERVTKRPFEDIVGPVGLDIGASDPAEIALSILAQIIEKRRT